MKKNNNFFIGTLGIVLVLVGAMICAGCTSSNASVSPSQQPSATVPVPASLPPVPAVATPVATGTSQPALTTATLSNGVTISYPVDWQKQVTSETSLRDYGRITTNIANFYSPDISPERATLASPNVDTSRYTTLSIDVDPNPVTDFEHYFNKVTLSLGEYYDKFDITKHNYQLNISKTDTFPGYKSYQMDFDSDKIRGTYIFTNVEGTVYIFAFKNPSPYSAEVHEMYDSVLIQPPVGSAEKHR